MRVKLLFLSLIIGSGTLYSQPDTSLLKIDRLLLNEQYSKALQFLSQPRFTSQQTAGVLLRKGQAYTGLYEYQNALAAYREANLLDAGNLSILYALGETFLSLGALSEAVQPFYKILLLDSMQVRAYIKLGQIYQKQQAYQAAINTYFTLRQLTPNSFIPYKELARCFEKTGKNLEAIGYYQMALEKNPLDINLYALAGKLLIQEDESKEAIKILMKGLAVDSTVVNLKKLSGLAYYRNHNYYKAIRTFEMLLQNSDSSIFVSKYMGRSLLAASYFHEATPYLESVAGADSTNAENYYYLALALSGDYHYKRSQSCYNRSLELLKPDPVLLSDIYMKMADNSRNLEQFSQAQKQYDLALRFNPSNLKALFLKASTYEYSQKDKEMALKYYQKFIDKMETSMTNKRKPTRENILTFRKIANQRIKILREELHFEGKLKEKK